MLFEFECAQHLTDRDKTNYINWFLRPYGLNASEVITDTSYDECEALHQEQGIEWYFCSWHFYKQLKQSAEFHDLVLQENLVGFMYLLGIAMFNTLPSGEHLRMTIQDIEYLVMNNITKTPGIVSSSNAISTKPSEPLLFEPHLITTG